MTELSINQLIKKSMKAIYLLPLALLVAACGNEAPSIDDLEEDSAPLVEQVLTEDDTDII